MATAFRDVERLLDGPVEFSRDWRARELRKRNRTIRFVLWAAVVSAYVSAMRVAGLHVVPLGPLLAGLYAIVPIAGAVREATGEIHWRIAWVISACVGVIATMGLRLGLDLQWLQVYFMVPSGLISLVGLSLAASFAGWCAAIPDRDIEVRRGWHVGRLLDNPSPRKTLTRRERLVVSTLLHGIFVPTLVGMTCVFLFIVDRAAPLVAVVTVSALYGAAMSLVCGVPLRLVFASTWRMLVAFVTYDRRTDAPPPDAVGYYRFPGALRDHRLRALMLFTLLVAATLCVVTTLDWPRPVDLSAALQATLDDRQSYQAVIAAAVVLASRVAALTAVTLFSLFLILAGWFGTFAAFTYREFAERAVAYAERASR